MKNLTRGILSLCLIGALLLSACGKADDSTTSEESGTILPTTPTPATNSPADSEKLIDPATKEVKEIAEADFTKGVFINFDPYQKSFFDDDIISKFNGNIEAVVEQDGEKFKEHLHEGSRGETYFFSEEGVQFMFYDLDLLEKLTVHGREQIRVGVQYAKKMADGTIQNQGITYFFTKNKAGEWGIENID
ncbi:hypothetical protein KDC22_03880 [Paenibacillus tritici]|uniref:hypothetical protein n=1 Tax=Paenibacillus tritici TaxID=1873425 RepID=UPI001BA84CCA|nr:hypothetical protein [Paenibacillus tritici]QUL55720.1 hypothetical protein KDC22_03880 [Paenibacillus tritici]